jgi:antitoxin component of MazEF toxin-antitoxin module
VPLIKKATRHGNSSGVILDQSILKEVGWEPGTEVEVKVEGDANARDFDAAADRVFKRHAKSLERLAK